MPSACSDRFAGDRISGRETEFRWTDGNDAEIPFALPPGQVRTSRWKSSRSSIPAQHVGIDINGTEIRAVLLTEPRWKRLQFNLPPCLMKSQNTLELRLSDAHRPPASGIRVCSALPSADLR
jgi:hypothetical protein